MNFDVIKLSTAPLPIPTNCYSLPLRLIVGFGFLEDGYAKLAHPIA